MTLTPLGDSAVVLAFSGRVDADMAARVHALAAEIERHAPAGVVDVVPAFTTVAVFYEIARSGSFEALCAALLRLAERADAAVVSDAAPGVRIPVCYGGEFGPDLAAVAAQHGLTPEQVIELHTGAEYLVHAIGFVPGFPYLGGLPARLATPRRATPRAQVPAGSVGIGGAQTGIYPFATPGGWNLLGRTPQRLFDPARLPAALLRAGDRVRFHAITAEEFQQLETQARQPVAHQSAGGAAPAVEVVHAGMLTTIQDLGRRGHRARGVPLSGAADMLALRLANLLAGNPDDAAGLEFTLVGPHLRFLRDTVIAVAGAEFPGMPRWQPLNIVAGTELKFRHARAGCRGYLAIAGGVEVAPVLGSRSTYARAGLGGLDGRPLRDGDRLAVADTSRRPHGRWHIDERILPPYSSSPTVRIVPGAQAGEFEPAALRARFTVTAHSDRMGVRLRGGEVKRTVVTELLSTAVAPGTVQVPPDGQPIVLLADAQTLGGYPQIAHVASVDLPLVAQLRPGDTVQFEPISLGAAHQLALARERTLAMVREGLAQKFS